MVTEEALWSPSEGEEATHCVLLHSESYTLSSEDSVCRQQPLWWHSVVCVRG